jgi:hypothetical protein
LKAAEKLISWEPIFHGLRQQPTHDSVARLAQQAMNLQAQAKGTTGQRRQLLMGDLSATMFLLYTVTSGDVGRGKYFPDWGPRPGS